MLIFQHLVEITKDIACNLISVAYIWIEVEWMTHEWLVNYANGVLREPGKLQELCHLKGYGASDNVAAWHGSLDVMTGQFDWLYALNPGSFLCLWCGCFSASPSPLSCVPWTLIPPLFRRLLWWHFPRIRDATRPWPFHATLMTSVYSLNDLSPRRWQLD